MPGKESFYFRVMSYGAFTVGMLVLSSKTQWSWDKVITKHDLKLQICTSFNKSCSTDNPTGFAAVKNPFSFSFICILMKENLICLLVNKILIVDLD